MQRAQQQPNLIAGYFSFQTGCPKGTYGSNCQNLCKCMNGGHCDPASGTCDCAPGFIGANCSKSKPTFMFCFCQNTAKRVICIRACQQKNRQIPATSSLNCKSGFQLCKKSLAKYFPSLLHAQKQGHSSQDYSLLAQIYFQSQLSMDCSSSFFLSKILGLRNYLNILLCTMVPLVSINGKKIKFCHGKTGKDSMATLLLLLCFRAKWCG